MINKKWCYNNDLLTHKKYGKLVFLNSVNDQISCQIQEVDKLKEIVESAMKPYEDFRISEGKKVSNVFLSYYKYLWDIHFRIKLRYTFLGQVH